MSRPSLLVVHPSGNSPRMASARIAGFLARLFQVPYAWDRPSLIAATGAGQEYEAVIIVNGVMAFSDCRQELYDLCTSVGQVIWVQNDYALDIPTEIRPYVVVIWSSMSENQTKVHPLEYQYINWNQLTYDPSIRAARRSIKTVPGLCYYGAYREDRVKYFDRYFDTNAYQVLLCVASVQKQQVFQARYPHARLMDMKHTGQLVAFEHGLYIEDEFSHNHYCSPANRFYEMLSAGVCQWFDHSCIHTFETVGLDIVDYVVEGPADLAKRMNAKDWHMLATVQSQRWDRDFRGELSARALELVEVL